MALILLPFMLIWFFTKKTIWFALAFSIAISFDIFAIKVGNFGIMLHMVFFISCFIYLGLVGVKFKLDLVANKDVFYLSLIVLVPIVYILSVSMLVYCLYFLFLSIMVNSVIVHRYGALEFSKSFPIIVTSLILAYSFFEVYGPKVDFHTYSTVYDFDSIRAYGGRYGRSLGPSREPSHLLLIEIVTIILGFKFGRRREIIYIILAWFLIAQFTYSRALFGGLLLTTVFMIISNVYGFKKYLAILLTLVPLISLFALGVLNDRFSSGFAFEADVSTLTRYGTLYLVIKQYVLSGLLPVQMLSENLSICRSTTSELERLACLNYAPALGYSAFLLSSLPFGLILIFLIMKRTKYLLFPLLLSGTMYFVLVTPAVVALTLLWQNRASRYE